MAERLKILIVEPEDVLRQSLVSIAARRFKVDLGSSGAAMRMAFECGVFDAVIVNSVLPDEDGLALVKAAENQGLGVIVVADGPGAERWIGNRRFQMLPKTFSDLQLLLAIDAALARKAASLERA
jgi:DNA-binding response OmpR family regulator